MAVTEPPSDGISWPAVRAGASVTATLGGGAFVALLVVRALTGESLSGPDAADWGGTARAAASVALVAGAFLGGGVSARVQAHRRMTHGSLGAAVGFVPVVVLASVLQIADGRWRPLAITNQILLAAVFGLIGGVLGAKVPHYGPRPDDEAPDA